MFDTDPTAAPADVPPALAGTYRAADRCGFLAGAGARLRWACWNARGTRRGSVVVLTGRGEFIEKYATEIVGELLERDFDVFAMDWRGQGLSDRPLADRDKGHVDSFATYIADLGLFLDKIVAPSVEPPTLALCHSMGGHILMRRLAEHGPGPFSAAVVSSPMTALQHEAFLRSMLMLMPERPAIDQRYLFHTTPFVMFAPQFAANHVTHDLRRYAFSQQWFEADPRLRLGGPTVGWTRQAARSMAAALAPGYLERIGLPVLLLSGGEDRLVDSSSHAKVAARLGRGELLTIAGARHEIMMETDDIRALFWQAFDRLAADLPGP